MHAFTLLLALAPALATDTPPALSGAALSARVLEQVQARLQTSGSTATVAVSGRVADMPALGADARLEVGEVAGRWPRARASVPVRVVGTNGVQRTTTVWLTASDVRTVLAYRADAAATTAADTLAWEARSLDMVCCEGTPVTQLDEVRGQHLQRAVRAGSPVLQQDFAHAPDVAAQQQIQLAVERGAVRIVVAGTALDNGAVGQRISVRPQGSRSVVQARIVAPAEAVIDE